MKVEMKGKLTIPNIARLDLLQHLGPNSGVHLLIPRHEFGLELNDLRDPATRDGLAEGLLSRPPRGRLRLLLFLLLLLLLHACRWRGRGARFPHRLSLGYSLLSISNALYLPLSPCPERRQTGSGFESIRPWGGDILSPST